MLRRRGFDDGPAPTARGAAHPPAGPDGARHPGHEASRAYHLVYIIYMATPAAETLGRRLGLHHRSPAGHAAGFSRASWTPGDTGVRSWRVCLRCCVVLHPAHPPAPRRFFAAGSMGDAANRATNTKAGSFMMTAGATRRLESGFGPADLELPIASLRVASRSGSWFGCGLESCPSPFHHTPNVRPYETRHRAG